LLLISCVNIINLFLARACRHSHEVSIRSALGASRRQLVLVHMAEAILVSLTGAVAGVALANGVVSQVRSQLPFGLPRNDEIALDSSTLLFALFVTIVSAIGCAAIPSWRSARTEPSEALQNSRSLTSSRRARHFRTTFVAVECGLCVVL